jgi:hypothetical protein
MEGDYRGAETDHVVTVGMKALCHHIFIVGYFQFVEIRHLHLALCSTAYGYAKGSKVLSQAAARGGCCNTTIEWFRGDIRKLSE